MNLSHLKGDILGGVTTAVVALPLALAFGVASGAGAAAGLYGAIAVGFFAAILGGTPAQVSGPTAPMAVIMAVIVSQYANDLTEAFTIVMLGGLFQVLLGAARVGRYISYTPYSVISGFMSGVGIILILVQILPLFGIAPATDAIASIRAWAGIPQNVNWDAVAIGGLCLGIMAYWPKSWRAIVPTPLAALLVGTVLAMFVFTRAPLLGALPTGLPSLTLPTIAAGNLSGVLQAAFILALLGSIDSLLTSLITDSITRNRHRSSRELVGQGIGNMVSGLIGGLPGAGATMRTVINIRAGGRTRLSGAVHALVLLGLVLGLAPLAETVPLAALAGILIKVGFDVIDWGYLARLNRAKGENALVMLLTLTLAVFVDLVTAIAVGIILASFVSARWMELNEIRAVTSRALPEGEDPLTREEREMLADADGQVAVIGLCGSFTYASARELTQRVDSETAGHRAVVFDFTDAAHIDTSVALAIDALLERTSRESACFVAALSGRARQTLQGFGVLDKLPRECVIASRLKAIEAAVASVAGPPRRQVIAPPTAP